MAKKITKVSRPKGKELQPEKKQVIKYDRRNYRDHPDRNKSLIKKSLEELGAGRSIVIDKDSEIIAGNGVYEQAQALGIPVRVIETDGNELVVVKRTDLKQGDEKRKLLALADNSTSDTSEFKFSELQEDFEIEELGEWGVEVIGEAKKKDYSDKIKSKFIVEIICDSEKIQKKAYDEISLMGYECRLLTL